MKPDNRTTEDAGDIGEKDTDAFSFTPCSLPLEQILLSFCLVSRTLALCGRFPTLWIMFPLTACVAAEWWSEVEDLQAN